MKILSLFQEGEYLDLWSVPHFLFGVILFIFLINKKVKTNTAVFIVFLLAVFWEFFEINVRLNEFFTNRITDVIVTLIGFYLLFFINKKTNFMQNSVQRETAWRYIMTFWILLNALGWMSYAFL